MAIADSNEVNAYVVTLMDVNDSVVATYNFESDTNLISGLTQNTLYTISMSTDCEDGSLTTPFTLTFRTDCSPVAEENLPYIEDFETYTSGAANPISTCWKKGVIGTTTQYPHPTLVTQNMTDLHLMPKQ